MALQNNVTDQSPWMKALLAANMSQPDDGSGGVATTTAQPMAPGAQGPAQTTTQRPLPTQPRREPQIDRIEDDRTAGTRGTTPQGSTAPRYAGANYHAADPARLPLEQQITSDRTQLDRLNNPTKGTLRERITGSIGAALQGASLGFSGNAGEIATLRDRAEARKQQERESLSQRIEQSTRQLSSEATQEEGMNLRARLAAQAQVAASERLGQTLAERTNLGREQIQGRHQDVETRTGSQEDIAAANRGQRATFEQDKLNMFKATQEYQRWKAQLDNGTRLHIAQMLQGKAPAALFQTAVFANGGIRSLNDAERAMAKLEKAGVFGQSWAQNKVEDWIFGKGAVDPSVPPDVRKTIGELRQALNLSASAMTRAHTQRGSKEVYDDLKQLLGPGQDWSALRGAISESQDMLGQYVQAASDQSIQNIRGGKAVAPTTPTGGNTITLDQFLKEK